MADSSFCKGLRYGNNSKRSVVTLFILFTFFCLQISCSREDSETHQELPRKTNFQDPTQMELDEERLRKECLELKQQALARVDHVKQRLPDYLLKKRKALDDEIEIITKGWNLYLQLKGPVAFEIRCVVLRTCERVIARTNSIEKWLDVELIKVTQGERLVLDDDYFSEKPSKLVE